ncbi:MAG: adenylosuccinate lyase [Candidatus Aenigmarchaeota archaeon]|nr:adenylosuccinate lyase [Candidatus Aenigmarchaeota archaeon]
MAPGVSSHASPICWRYGSEAMRAIFLEEGKLRLSLEVEAALACVQARYGIIPQEAADDIGEHASLQYVTPEAVFAREQEIQHDVKAMVDLLAAACTGEGRRFVHYGATSYDIEDNRLSRQLQAATGMLVEDVRGFGKALAERAAQYRDLPAIGRTHGQWAEPITMGFKLAQYVADCIMDYRLLGDFLDRYLVGKPMTGAVGTAASLVQESGDAQRALQVGRDVMRELGLRPALATTQVVPRKMHAYGLHTVAQSTATAGRFAQEVWDLQRPEIREVREKPYKQGQVGSSAMPHKAAFGNPINAENIIGLHRAVRDIAAGEMDNILLHHERDLSNSGNERVTIPATYLLADEALWRAASIARSMEVNESMVRRNLAAASAFTATEPLMLALTGKGMAREDAHARLQEAAHRLYLNPDMDPVAAFIADPEIYDRMGEGEVRGIIGSQAAYIGAAREMTDEILAVASGTFR